MMIDDSMELEEIKVNEGQAALSPKRILSYFKKIFRHGNKEVGIILDGPNILRKVGGKKISLREIREKCEKLGHITRAIAVLSTDAPAPLIKALSNSGFEVIIPPGDVHVAIAVEVMKMIKERDIDVIIVGSRDTRCLPILQKIKNEGAIAVAMGFEPGFAIALKNVADEIILLNPTIHEEISD
ncbi:MAG: NYN domain-containing protein [Candidatus Njordarchaeia archaeon]|nr:NYN domain-containing protein [Candidatus Korarchaeota archaeon]